MEYPSIKNQNNMNQGPGSIFMTPPNTDFSEAELLPVGVISDDGINIDLLEDFFPHKSNGFEVADPELISCGIEVSFSLKETDAENFRKMMGFGTLDTDVAAPAEAFTNKKLKLYGYKWSEFPFNNVTVTTVTDNLSTPTSYAVSDIEIDGTPGNNDGRVRLSSDSDITPSDAGVNLLVSGTRNKRETVSQEVGWDTDSDHYGMRIKKRNKAGNWHYIDIYRACAVGSPKIEYKHGTAVTYACKFRGILEPDQLSLYKKYFETP